MTTLAKSSLVQIDDSAPALTAKLAPWMAGLIKHPAIISDWLKNYSSPCHVVVPNEFRRNVRDLLAPMKERGLSGGLYFARKANKLACFVKAALQEKIGVDTASLNELKETLSLGLPPEAIVFTAIGKDQLMLQTAMASGCLIVIDNEDELNLLCQVVGSIKKTARIGLRFSGFEIDGRRIFSRFGLPIKDAANLIASVGSNENIKIELLHAHLDRYDIRERAAAAWQLVQILDLANSAGQQIRGIDLGGGILIRYLELQSQWQEFQDALLSAVKEARPSFTYLQDGLGFFKAGDEVLGKADFYPAWNALSKERFIAAILDQTVSGRPLHKEFSERQIALFFEPGRALLDNAGMTFASVSFRKRDTEGNLLVGLNMNRMNLRPFRAEFCSDPLLIAEAARIKMSEGAFIVGNLCSEGDTIFRRKIRLQGLPLPGDIIAFANSAGYLAHHMEIGTHGNGLPCNLLFDPETGESSLTP